MGIYSDLYSLLFLPFRYLNFGVITKIALATLMLSLIKFLDSLSSFFADPNLR